MSKLTALYYAEELLKNSALFGINRRWKGRNYDSYNFAAPMKLGDQEKIVEFTIIRKPDGRQELYNIKVMPKELVKEGAPSTLTKRPIGEKSSSLTTPHSLPQSSVMVNGENEKKVDVPFGPKMPKLPSSNLVRQYLAANGLLAQYVY